MFIVAVMMILARGLRQCARGNAALTFKRAVGVQCGFHVPSLLNPQGSALKWWYIDGKKKWADGAVTDGYGVQAFV